MLTGRAVIYCHAADPSNKFNRAAREVQLAQQEEACRRYAAVCGYALDAEDVYRDICPENTSWERLGLRQLLAEARAGTVGFVMVTERRRLCRRLEISRAIVEEFARHNVRIVDVTEETDDSPAGHFYRAVRELATTFPLPDEAVLEDIGP